MHMVHRRASKKNTHTLRLKVKENLEASVSQAVVRGTVGRTWACLLCMATQIALTSVIRQHRIRHQNVLVVSYFQCQF